MTDTIQGDLREIAREILRGDDRVKAAHRVLDIADEIDRAVRPEDRSDLPTTAGHRTEHWVRPGAGATWM